MIGKITKSGNECNLSTLLSENYKSKSSIKIFKLIKMIVIATFMSGGYPPASVLIRMASSEIYF